METYLPLIQSTLTEWLQLTLEHPLYAALLIITVWIVTALLYSIKVAGLNKKNTVSEQTKIAAEANLNTAQQQLQQAQGELAAAIEQHTQSQRLADTEKQRATTAEQQLIKRNQQISAIIQSLANSFDIGQRPLPVTEDLKSDELWQQHGNVIQQLIERLRSEQLAKTELQKSYQAEKDKAASAENLQAKVNSQSDLIATLQQELNNALKQHQADLVRLVELERQGQTVAVADTHEATQPISAPAVQPAPATTPVSDSADKLKSLFKKPAPEQPAIAATPTPVVPASPVHVEPIIEIKPEPAPIIKPVEQTEITPPPARVELKPEPKVQPQTAASTNIPDVAEKTTASSALKGFYNKFTSTKSAEQPEIVKPEPKAIEPVAKAVEQPVAPVEPAKPAAPRTSIPKKRLEVKPLSVEPSSRIDEAADLITEKVDKLKGLYGKFFSKSE